MRIYMSNKRKIVLILSIMIFLITSLVAVYFVTRPPENGIPSGIYMIKDNDRYPNAYAEVSEKTIQFFMIDLNEYYQEMQKTSYRRVIENDPGYYGVVTEDELNMLTDLNAIYVDNPYDYSTSEVSKVGTNLYSYFTLYHDNFLGVVTHYDTKDKLLKIMRNKVVLTFERTQ